MTSSQRLRVPASIEIAFWRATAAAAGFAAHHPELMRLIPVGLLAAAAFAAGRAAGYFLAGL
jgi:hypothetical protein